MNINEFVNNLPDNLFKVLYNACNIRTKKEKTNIEDVKIDDKVLDLWKKDKLDAITFLYKKYPDVGLFNLRKSIENKLNKSKYNIETSPNVKSFLIHHWDCGKYSAISKTVEETIDVIFKTGSQELTVVFKDGGRATCFAKLSKDKNKLLISRDGTAFLIARKK